MSRGAGRAIGCRERIILKVLITCIAAGGVLTGLMWFGQRRLIYRPDRERVPPAAAGLPGVAEVLLPTRDGETLVVWHAPASPGALTVLYFHGNGAGLSDRADRIRILQGAGYGVVMMAYRGYSGSSGSPSETANIADAMATYAWLRTQGVAAEKIVLFGESLGTGVAVQMAAAKPVAGVILDSPFTSLVDVAAYHYRFLPIRWFLRDRYVSTDFIGQVRVPLLIVHGEEDQIVPLVFGRRLFATANEPKQFVVFPGVGHVVPFSDPDNRKSGWPVIHSFLHRIAHAKPASE